MSYTSINNAIVESVDATDAVVQNMDITTWLLQMNNCSARFFRAAAGSATSEAAVWQTVKITTR